MAHRMIKDWSVKEFQKLLRINGYTYTRAAGSHLIYTKEGCKQHIAIPATNLNMMVARRLIKENNLDTSDFIK